MSQFDTFWLSKNPMLRAIRRWVSIYPDLYIPLRKLRRADTVVTQHTDLLIEGFPRSGNTWTEALLREASQDTLALAHHAHAAAHVKRAIKLGVPSIVLFRDPDDAVASLLALYENQLDARGAFLEYVRFYQAIWPLRGPLVRFYSFTDVTQCSAAAVADMSLAFHLAVSADALTDAAVFARMDEKAARLKRRRTEHSKSRPDIDPNSGNDRRDYARRAILSEKAADARAAASQIYGKMTSDLRSVL